MTVTYKWVRARTQMHLHDAHGGTGVSMPIPTSDRERYLADKIINALNADRRTLGPIADSVIERVGGEES